MDARSRGRTQPPGRRSSASLPSSWRASCSSWRRGLLGRLDGPAHRAARWRGHRHLPRCRRSVVVWGTVLLTGPARRSVHGRRRARHPPVGLVLFVPFVFAPDVLWWVIPLGVIGWSVLRMRPGPWGWVGIGACLAFPQTVQRSHAGNPVIWIAAAFALSFRWPWVGVMALLKPSLFPSAFGGVRTREWWLALGALAAVSLAFLPMWFDWIGVMLTLEGSSPGRTTLFGRATVLPARPLGGQDRQQRFRDPALCLLAGHPRRALPAGEAATPAAAPHARRRTHVPPRLRGRARSSAAVGARTPAGATSMGRSRPRP